MGVMNGLMHGNTEQFIRLIAQHLCGRQVAEGDPPIDIQPEYAFTSRVENQSLPFFRLDQGLCGKVALRNVPRDSKDAAYIPCTVLVGHLCRLK